MKQNVYKYSRQFPVYIYNAFPETYAKTEYEKHQTSILFEVDTSLRTKKHEIFHNMLNPQCEDLSLMNIRKRLKIQHFEQPN